MFANAAQIVTLFAFTAHAVLGCCWHHSHAVAQHTAEAAAEPHLASCSNSPADAACGHRPPAQTQPPCGHSHAAEVSAANQDGSGRQVTSSCCSSSHQPTDHCSAGRCSYISAKHLTWELTVGASLEGFVTCCDLQGRMPAVHANRDNGQRPFFSAPHSCGDRCAYLQTWQI